VYRLLWLAVGRVCERSVVCSPPNFFWLDPYLIPATLRLQSSSRETEKPAIRQPSLLGPATTSNLCASDEGLALEGNLLVAQRCAENETVIGGSGLTSRLLQTVLLCTPPQLRPAARVRRSGGIPAPVGDGFAGDGGATRSN
jgi:hypothetical protein